MTRRHHVSNFPSIHLIVAYSNQLPNHFLTQSSFFSFPLPSFPFVISLSVASPVYDYSASSSTSILHHRSFSSVLPFFLFYVAVLSLILLWIFSPSFLPSFFHAFFLPRSLSPSLRFYYSPLPSLRPSFLPSLRPSFLPSTTSVHAVR